MELVAQFVDSDLIGYGQLGVGLTDALTKLGVNVVHPELKVEDFDSGLLPKTNVALWVTVPSHVRGYWEGQQVWTFTMWEAGRLPESFTESFDDIHGIIVPNRFNLEQFSQRHPNVHMVPLGVDPDMWTPRKRNPNMFLDFLICGAGERKGTQLAFDAFQAAFPNYRTLDPMPRLIMKNHRENFWAENVVMIGQRLDTTELVSLYHSAHVYVQPSHGEGWGLQPHQALATGMPTILSDIPGHQEYAETCQGALLVPTRKAKSSYFIYGDAGDWWKPEFDALVEAYRKVYGEWGSYHYRAFHHDSPYLRHNFSWERTARGVVDVLGKDSLEAAYSGSGAWNPTKRRRFSTTLIRDWKADIAGLSYQWKKGVTYYEYADVKRILFEAGLLDSECLRDEAILPNGETMAAGLTDDQIALIRGQTGSQGGLGESVCPTCLQTLPEKAHV